MGRLLWASAKLVLFALNDSSFPVKLDKQRSDSDQIRKFAKVFAVNDVLLPYLRTLSVFVKQMFALIDLLCNFLPFLHGGAILRTGESSFQASSARFLLL